MVRLFAAAAGAMLLMASGGMFTENGAQAQELELRVGPGGAGIQTYDDGYHPHRRYYQERPRYVVREGCDPREAEYSARRYGLHRPRVVRITPRSVTVSGYTRGERGYMRFANVPGCPAFN